MDLQRTPIWIWKKGLGFRVYGHTAENIEITRKPKVPSRDM